MAGTAVAQPKSLGFRAHELVADMWAALGRSIEAQFYSAADWERARWELWHANSLIEFGVAQASSWTAVQAGLSALLVSPADKLRAGIELRQAVVDPDEVAADAMLAEFQHELRVV